MVKQYIGFNHRLLWFHFHFHHLDLFRYLWKHFNSCVNPLLDVRFFSLLNFPQILNLYWSVHGWTKLWSNLIVFFDKLHIGTSEDSVEFYLLDFLSLFFDSNWGLALIVIITYLLRHVIELIQYLWCVYRDAAKRNFHWSQKFLSFHSVVSINWILVFIGIEKLVFMVINHLVSFNLN